MSCMRSSARNSRSRKVRYPSKLVVVGAAQGASEDIMADLRANFEGECSEVGTYLQWLELLIEKDILKLTIL